MSDQNEMPRFLRPAQVYGPEGLTSLGRTAVLEMVKAGEFPQPISLSPSGRSKGWLESEVLAWAKERAANGRLPMGVKKNAA